ncbi:D-aminoacyl-tRNA deacylase [Staphylothermus hellenicus]|uniref:D-aminoacyl-tRNA deacylase n=1 Tax=Staphylothermus hellenicus (strain DSM 12710 / JCM 10830 / BK20S6-10-b1 / P8) TaxID=591019 RepID=D7DBE5_STAHD|nr:D-aminoacyl-tRNA deacylase [Staphylothermus hellenicus]ADI31492.1 Protein of unknown function DUF516 [Staphylothermus hellenicus DSM 12710]
MEIYGIAYSINDPAGSGMAEYIVKYYGLGKSDVCRDAITCYVGDNFVLAGFREDVIYFDFLDDRLPENVSRYIILSRHSSAKKVRSYTVHHTGNFGPEAPYGGRPRILSIANPIVSHKLLINLKMLAEEYGRINEYEVSYEATHHGPTDVRKPLNFIEIGSSIDEWKDPVNHEIAALAVIKFLENPRHKCVPVTGIGGGHYPRKHTKMAFEKNYCYGHIMAKYALQHLSPEILEEMIVKSDPVPQRIVVEKKGTRREHRRVIEQYVLGKGIILEYI